MKTKQTPQTRSPMAKLLMKTLIVTLVAGSTIILGMMGPEMLGEWMLPALGLVVIAGLALALATR